MWDRPSQMPVGSDGTRQEQFALRHCPRFASQQRSTESKCLLRYCCHQATTPIWVLDGAMAISFAGLPPISAFIWSIVTSDTGRLCWFKKRAVVVTRQFCPIPLSVPNVNRATTVSTRHGIDEARNILPPATSVDFMTTVAFRRDSGKSTSEFVVVRIRRTPSAPP